MQIYPANREAYKKYSDQLYKLLLEYTDKIERFSIDECFLDMTKYLMNDTLLNKAKEINKRVIQELGFTVNIGLANNKLLAKMASDFEKPDKIHTLFKEEIPTKMWPLPVSELFMIGKKTVPKLTKMGIKTIGDLAKANRQTLVKQFGKFGELMWNNANGIDNQEVKYIKEDPKSIGHSVTLPHDTSNIEKIKEIVLKLTEQVTYRLRRYELYANVVNVQLRTKDFKDFSHQRKLDQATSNTKDIYKIAKELLYQMYKENIPIRLVGVRVGDLVKKEEIQLSLFSTENSQKQEKLDKTIDNLKQKYGYNIITRMGNSKGT